MNCIWSMILLSWCTCVQSVPTSMKTYTLYTNEQSWNAANLICSLRGGYLVKIESSSENSFLLNQLDDKWDIGVKSFYIGLHNAALKKDSAEYFWTDCTPLGSYENLKASFYEYVWYCVSLHKSSLFNNDYWGKKTCTDLDAFVCETDGGPCEYIVSNNSTGTKGITYNASKMGQNECLLLCNEAVLSGMECWGVTYNLSIETCILHLSNDSTIFDNSGIRSNTGSNFFKKKCLHVEVNNTVYPSILPTNIPYTNCLSASTSGSIYTIFERRVTWLEAKDVCSHIGASLLEYRSQEELTDVLNIAAPSLVGISTFWIGLKRFTNLTFQWQDGTDISTWDNWESSPSNTLGTCTRASTNLLWLDDNCTNRHSFICEQPGVCGYEELSKTIADDGNSHHFTTTHDECINICDNDATCIAYSYPFKCKTYHQSDIYYYFHTSNYQSYSFANFYRYSCSHVDLLDKELLTQFSQISISGLVKGSLLIGNISVQIPNLYHPSGINPTVSYWTSSSTIVAATTSRMQEVTSSVSSELSEVSAETFSFIVSSTGNIEVTESFIETASSTGVSLDSDSTFHYSETVQQPTETIRYSTDSLDNLDPSTFDSYTDSVTPSSTLKDTTLISDISTELSVTPSTTLKDTTLISDISTELSVTPSTTLKDTTLISDISTELSVTPSTTLKDTTLISDISTELSVTPSSTLKDTTLISVSPEVLTISEMSSINSVIGKTIEPSFTSALNGYSDTSGLVENTSPLQTVPLSEFPTLYPPMQTKYIPVCPCRCISKVVSRENIGDRIQKLVKDLTLNKTNLSSTLHSLYSIEDNRPSAQTLGYSSIILLLCVFSFFLIMDISHFILHRSTVAVITK